MGYSTVEATGSSTGVAETRTTPSGIPLTGILIITIVPFAVFLWCCYVVFCELKDRGML